MKQPAYFVTQLIILSIGPESGFLILNPNDLAFNEFCFIMMQPNIDIDVSFIQVELANRVIRQITAHTRSFHFFARVTQQYKTFFS